MWSQTAKQGKPNRSSIVVFYFEYLVVFNSSSISCSSSGIRKDCRGGSSSGGSSSRSRCRSCSCCCTGSSISSNVLCSIRAVQIQPGKHVLDRGGHTAPTRQRYPSAPKCMYRKIQEECPKTRKRALDHADHAAPVRQHHPPALTYVTREIRDADGEPRRPVLDHAGIMQVMLPPSGIIIRLP